MKRAGLLLSMLMIFPALANDRWYLLNAESRSCGQLVERTPSGEELSRATPESVIEDYLLQEATRPPIKREEADLPDGSKRLTLRTVNKVGPIERVFFTSRKACEDEVKEREIAAGIRPAPLRTEKGETYVMALRKRYGDRIRYADRAARSAVDGFKVDCQTGDGRYLPLANVLLAKLLQADSPTAWLTLEVVSAAGAVEVREKLVGPTGPVMAPRTALTIHQNGKLQMHGVRAEAVLNACFSELAVAPKQSRK